MQWVIKYETETEKNIHDESTKIQNETMFERLTITINNNNNNKTKYQINKLLLNEKIAPYYE